MGGFLVALLNYELTLIVIRPLLQREVTTAVVTCYGIPLRNREMP
jgi:hypothetical protein